MEVLLLHRHLHRADVLAGITAALSVGSVNPDVVALEARKATERRTTLPAGDVVQPGAQVLVLAAHRAGVPADAQPLPCMDKYDILLGRETS